MRFSGLHKHTFYFHLKECAFRFNHRRLDARARAGTCGAMSARGYPPCALRNNASC
ncbi:hypothetical protein KL86DES1_21381 [uncultured Desulfovibrio sp.]|uniref:Uncharacterized protein n=1 Tax=uncultured Desulfovibrio sp. TaxID=167968 RepID=A0A212L7Q1_9BACT|nr:hypothetical protein KL86DES1_21381 [uncultured Desulfovibrio sp.]